jgi:hypothetical protein
LTLEQKVEQVVVVLVLLEILVQDMLSLDWITLVVAVVLLLPPVLKLLEDQVEEVLSYLDTHKYLKKSYGTTSFARKRTFFIQRLLCEHRN